MVSPSLHESEYIDGGNFLSSSYVFMPYTIGCDHSCICMELEAVRSYKLIYTAMKAHQSASMNVIHAESESSYTLRFLRVVSDFRTRRSKLPLQWRSCHIGSAGSVGADPSILYLSRPLPLVRIPQEYWCALLCFLKFTEPFFTHHLPMLIRWHGDPRLPGIHQCDAFYAIHR